MDWEAAGRPTSPDRTPLSVGSSWRPTSHGLGRRPDILPNFEADDRANIKDNHLATTFNDINYDILFPLDRKKIDMIEHILKITILAT